MSIHVTEHWFGPGARDREIAPVPLSENGCHESPSKSAFEHWYFDARLDDGRMLVGFLQSSELMTKRPGVELHVYNPDGSRHEVRKHYPASAVQVSSQRCDVKVGHNHAKVIDQGPGGLLAHHVFIREDGLEFDLRFDSDVPMWRPGHGKTSYGSEDFFAWVVAAPRARVSGTVTVNGRRSEVQGVGYHDHNWGVGTMGRIVDHWYWGRIYADDLTCIYANVFTTERYGRQVSKPFMLARGSEVVLSTGEVTITEGPRVYDARADQHYPSTLSLRAEDGLAELKLTVREVLHAHDLIDDVPVVKNPLVKMFAKPLINTFVGRPGYFRFRSDFTLSARIRGEQIVRTGSTLHEAVALR
jgi:CrtC N-terminal lipocalin domain